MARRSTKHSSREADINLRLTDGVNLSAPNNIIQDSEAYSMQNWTYRVNSDSPMVRPAIRCVTAADQKFATPIVSLHFYIKDSSTSYLMCVSGNKLYYLDGSDEWQEVGAVATGSIPVMITFNGKLLLADGGDLHSWDGTTYTTDLTGGTYSPSTVREHQNRVLINNTAAGGLDQVILSGVEDETDWTMGSGHGISLRAGYKDGLEVVALESYFDNIIVSKADDGGNYKTMRIQTTTAAYVSGAATWKVEPLFGATGAFDAQNMVAANNTIFYMSTVGFSMISSTDAYSEIHSQEIGAKINPVFSTRTIPEYRGVVHIAKAGTILIFQKDSPEFIVYHPWNRAYTTWKMATEEFYCAAQGESEIYLAGSTGQLFKINDTSGTDQPTPSSTTKVAGTLITKNVTFEPSQGLVKRISFWVESLTEGTITFYVRKNSSGEYTQVGSATLSTGLESQDLNDWTVDFGGLSTDITSYPEQDLVRVGTEMPFVEVCRSRYRARDISIKVTTSGRCGLAQIKIVTALVGV